ncbi:MAG: zf-HC2 domain-containing protein [Vicinamibacterales bacterium]
MESLLPPYVDGEASAVVRHTVEQHLASCPACREAVEAQRQVRELLVSRRARLIDAAPSGLEASVRAAGEADAAVARRPRWSALAAAAGLVLALVGGLSWATGASSVLLAAQLTLDHLKCFVIDGDEADGISASAGEERFHDHFDMQVRLPEPASDGRAKLVSVRQCLYGEGWIAHALYRVDGDAVSVFVIDGTRDRAALDLLGRHADVRMQDGHTLVIVAPARLPRVAEALGLEAE